MIRLNMKGFRWDRELQIIQADVYMEAERTVLLDEAVCVDVGMPALALSLTKNIRPNRWSPPEDWRGKPFFVCGCGDPECKAHSFDVRHMGDGMVLLSEVEEREDGSRRVLDEFRVSAAEYGAQVSEAVRQFLSFAETLEAYQPLFEGTLDETRNGLARYG